MAWYRIATKLGWPVNKTDDTCKSSVANVAGADISSILGDASVFNATRSVVNILECSEHGRLRANRATKLRDAKQPLALKAAAEISNHEIRQDICWHSQRCCIA